MSGRIIRVKSCGECPYRKLQVDYDGYHFCMLDYHRDMPEKEWKRPGQFPSWCRLEKEEK